MSKFLNLCSKVERLIKEEGEVSAMAHQQQASADPNANVAAGEPVVSTGQTLDPKQGSDIQEVSNDEIEKMIQSIVDFYKAGQALSNTQVEKIKQLPSKIEASNSKDTVEQIIQIFGDANLPKEADALEA